MNRFLGGVSMTLEHLLMSMGSKGHVTTNFPLAQNLVTPANLQRLKGIPIFLFSSADNEVFSPESTDRTYTILRDTFGSRGYERVEVQGYGHLDWTMGTNAVRDVYPMIRKKVDRVVRGPDYVYRE
jgi:hypothetical protein